jgi:ArsR family transcriptional regulator
MRIDISPGIRELETHFKGVADATRLRIINLLSWGELCGCDIQGVLGAAQPNISRHLTYLKHAGLVVDRREGFRIFYRLTPAKNGTLKNLFQFLALAFRRDDTFRNDLRRLRHAIKDGACKLPLVAAPPGPSPTGSSPAADRASHGAGVDNQNWKSRNAP